VTAPYRNEHFLMAIIEGQTRAMNRYWWEGSVVRLDYERFEHLIGEVASLYYRGAKMKWILEFVLMWNEPFDSDAERHGYKVALGIEFYRRKRLGIEVIEQLDRTRPFAPR
jgi:hypothetical protein